MVECISEGKTGNRLGVKYLRSHGSSPFEAK